MTAKEYCANNPIVAYYSGFCGLEIHGVDYGINDYLYCVTGAWGKKKQKRYHKLKIHYDHAGQPFIQLRGYKIPLDECVRIGAGW